MKGAIEQFSTAAKYLPFESLFSSSSRKQIEKDLRQAGISFPKGKYLPFSLFSSIAISIYFTFLSTFIFSDQLKIAASFLLFFALFFYIIKSFPKMEKRKRALQVEADLPMVLRQIAIELEIKMPFGQAMKHIAESDYRISDEFEKLHKSISKGESVPHTLNEVSERIDSLAFKRSVNQLIISYEYGGDAEPIKKIANELINIQLSKTKEFNAKMAFLSLLFIATSCLVPSFFLVFLMVGSVFLSLPFTALHIWAIFLFLFPLLNAIVLLYINSRTPPHLSAKKQTLSDQMEQISAFLEERNFPLSLKQSALAAILISILIAAPSFLLSWQYPELLFASFAFLLFPFLIYFYLLYIIEKRKLLLEKMLPDALFHAASLQKSFSMEKIISSIAKSDYGPLSHEFMLAHRQINAKASVRSALLGITKRNSSLLLDRSINLLLRGYETGADLYLSLRETAEDIFSLFSLVRERRSALALQKYTLLIGGAILVPLILGTVLNMVSGLNVPQTDLFPGTENREGLVSATSQSIEFYLISYALLSSILVARQEGEDRKFLIYFLFSAPLVYALFKLSSSVSIFSLLI